MPECVILLPQIALLGVARKAWAEAVGGWLPRFETVGTLLDRLPAASALASPPDGAAFALDARTDTLWVAQRLAAEPRGRAWRGQDAAGFEVAVGRVVSLAHDWLKVCLAYAPAERESRVLQARLWLSQQAGVGGGMGGSGGAGGGAEAAAPGQTEVWLAARAIGWALDSLPWLVGRRAPLFAHRPAAWMAVTVGDAVVPGSESALMLAVLQHARVQGVSVCWVPACVGHDSADPVSADEAGNATQDWPTLIEARDAEDEAQAAAAALIRAVQRSRDKPSDMGLPVALVAQDRMLTRRVRALLAEHEQEGCLRLVDESGWKLSTTRAAAVVTRLLAAAHPQASADEVLDWLVSGWVSGFEPEPDNHQAIGALEAHWRRQGVLKPWALADDNPVWRAAQAILQPVQALHAKRSQSLPQALYCVVEALHASGAWQALAADAAGQQVIDALHLSTVRAWTVGSGSGLDGAQAPNTQWLHVALTTRVNLADVLGWVQQALEEATFMPPPTQGVGQGRVDVVVTPMSRAVLRPFAAVILPGADDTQLGPRPSGTWLPPAAVRALGLAEPEQQQRSQWQAFAVLACAPRMQALARQVREREPVAPSPWLTRWWLAQTGQCLPQGWPVAADPRLAQAVSVSPQQRPTPALIPLADPLAPQRLSASAYEQLRACPYQFFARSLLGMKHLDEIEEGLLAADYGTWLHAVLKSYHQQRPAVQAPNSLDDDIALWMRVAQEQAESHGLLSEAQRAFFGPHAVTLPKLAAAYVSWLRAQEAAGWRWEALEQRLELQVELQLEPDFPLASDTALPEGAARVTLYGDLDRVDRRAMADGTHWRVMDYKTGGIQPLKDKVRQPLEDTQLAFYALLAHHRWQEAMQTPMQAIYLRVHQQGIDAVDHPAPLDSATALHTGARADLSRIWAGHPMPALGEGQACEHCDVRGLCRKDHGWGGETA